MAEAPTTATEFTFLLCPITRQLFNDPVLAEDGHTYEREAIVEWIARNGTSPVTRQPLNANQLRPNCTIKNIVDELRSKNYYFKLDVDIKKKSRRALFQAHGKTVWEAEWIGKAGTPICLMKINGVKALKEASFYEKMTRHPHIVKTYGIVDEPADVVSYSIMLLQEYASEGNLFELLQEHSSVPNANVLSEMFVQISDAMAFLAHNQIVHGDLACRNVLVFRYDANESKNNLVKLTDFGLSRGSSMYAPVGATSATTLTVVPIRYAAPEVLSDSNNRSSYTEKSDMFSMGVLMWEGYSKGEMPWSNIETDNEVSQKVRNAERLKQPSKCSDRTWQMVLKCMSQQPNDRPSFQELKRQLLESILGSSGIRDKPVVFIRVANAEDDEVTEIPVEEENYVSLATLNWQFPGIVGLKYRSAQTNEWHTVVLLNTKFQQPQHEPPATVYIAVYSEGFRHEDIIKYVHQFFIQLGDYRRIEARHEKAEALIDFLKSHPKIWQIACVPITLGLICHLWSTEHTLAVKRTTVTQLYREIIQCLLRQHLENQSIGTNYMDNDEIYGNCQQEMALLQTIAFEGVKSNTSFLKKDTIQSALRKIEPDPSKRAAIAEKLTKIGMLRCLSENECRRKNETERAYYFIDVNLQYYFAAQYLTNYLVLGDDAMIQFIQTQKYIRRYRTLFSFASGLASDRTAFACVEIFWKALCSPPLDLVGMRHMKLVISYLNEVNEMNMVPTYDLLLNKIEHCLKTCLSKQTGVNWRLIRLLEHNHFVQQPRLMIDILCYTISKKSREAIKIAASLTESVVTPQLIDNLVVMINSPDHEMQSIAVSVLRELVKITITPQLLDILLRLVKHQDLTIANSAAPILQGSLQHKPMPAVVQIMLNALNIQDYRVRKHAATALGKLDGKAVTNEVITGLLQALKDPNDDVRCSVVSAVQELAPRTATPEAINALLQALKDQNPNVRKKVASALGSLGDKAATTEVITELLLALKDQGDGVRSSAASSLAALVAHNPSPEVIRMLLQASWDNDHCVRKSAAAALGKLGSTKATTEVINRLLQLMKDQDNDVRWDAALSLPALVTTSGTLNVMNSLLQMLEREDILDSTYCVLKMLVEERSTPEMSNRLIETARHRNMGVRSRGIFLLGKLGARGATTEAINALLLLLKDPDEDVIFSTRSSLESLVEKSSSSAIINILVNALKDADHRVREHSASALGGIDNKAVTTEVITGLLQALKDRNQNVRKNVAVALGKLGDKAATPAVITELLLTLKDPDRDVRCSAVWTVQKLGAKTPTPEMIHGLVHALQDQSPIVRKSVALALGSFGNKTVTPEVITGLIPVLNDEDRDARFNATSAMERLGAKAATLEVIDGLMRALKKQNNDVAWRAAYALEVLVKKNPAPEVIDLLIRTIREQDHGIRCHVIRVFGELDCKQMTAEVVDCLLLAVNDSDNDIQRRVTSALRRAHLSSAVLSKLNIDILSILARYEYVFDSTALAELIGAYLETENDIWLSFISNQALRRESGVILVEENLLVFENEDQPSEIDGSTKKTSTTLKTLVQWFDNQAKEYGLWWNKNRHESCLSRTF